MGNSKQIFESLASLEGDRDFQVFLEWLEMKRSEETLALYNTKDPVLTGWLQGKCQFITELLELARSARVIIRK